MKRSDLEVVVRTVAGAHGDLPLSDIPAACEREAETLEAYREDGLSLTAEAVAQLHEIGKLWRSVAAVARFLLVLRDGDGVVVRRPERPEEHAVGVLVQETKA